MTREEFIDVLDNKQYPYEIEGNKIVVIGEYVSLDALTSLPPGVEFKNGGTVYLHSLTSIPPGVEFNNGNDVNLDSLTGDWFDYWKGNIEGIEYKRLLNKMIKDGIFER
jgi:hypothetical protein